MRRLTGNTGVLAPGAWYPFVCVVPMGCTWAFWVAQRSHLNISLNASGVHCSRATLDKLPAPEIVDDTPLLMPYCDNGTVIVTSRSEVDRVAVLIIDAMIVAGFSVHEVTTASTYATTLGACVDGVEGLLRPTEKRVAQIIAVINFILVKGVPLSGQQLEKLLGHITFVLLIH